MAKKKSSSTAALVEHNVADEERPERLTLEETWPTETVDEDGTEIFSNESSPSEAQNLEVGVSESGPFIAPAPVTPPEAPTTSKRPKQTVASMPRDLAFAKFRDSLFTLCFKFGFTLDVNSVGGHIQVVDVSDAKGSAKRALAVSSMADLELRK